MIMYAVFGTRLKNKLTTTLNTLLRFVLDLERRAHISKEHFELLNWLPVNFSVDHLTLCHFLK